MASVPPQPSSMASAIFPTAWTDFCIAWKVSASLGATGSAAVDGDGVAEVVGVVGAGIPADGDALDMRLLLCGARG